MKNILFTLFVVVVLGLAFVAGSYIYGNFIYKSRLENTNKVVGFASKAVEADTVKWAMTITKDTDQKNLKQAYIDIGKDIEKIKSILTASGIEIGEIEVEPINSYPVYDGEGNIKNQSVSQNIKIVSKKLDVVEKIALNPTVLLDNGIIPRISNLGYFVSNLSEIKRELAGNATIDAGKRAAEIAKSTGGKLGKITSAKLGVIQITEPFSNEVSDYGIYNLSSRNKEVKATVNVTYMIE
jgi:hypothetical protein